tara:strand:- start:1252 stop:2016 length:765 start_codon:yes stop_codon:yes gene_type:complete
MIFTPPGGGYLMRHYKVNKIQHTVFDTMDEVPSDMEVVPNWRDSSIGDWVKADDDCVIQILRRGNMMRDKGKNRVRSYVGTCTGTFVCLPRTKMDTSRRRNIYSIGGELSAEERVSSRTTLSKNEVLFVQYLSSGLTAQNAYLKAFPTNNPHYANTKSASLIKTERIVKAMKRELEPIVKELGISPKYVLDRIKAEADSSDKADVRLKALFKLSDILDLEDKSSTKVTQVTGALFQGFSEDQLEAVERPKEIKG